VAHNLGLVSREPDVDHAKWLEWRRAGIGSSDAAGIAGISPWSSPIAVWLDKMALAGDVAPSEAMTWGLLLEPVIIKEFEDRTGLWVVERQKQIVHPAHEWMRATVDGFAVPGDADISKQLPAAAVLYEGKTAGDWGRADWADGVPLHYVAQVMHSMCVTGMPAAWVVALLSGQKLVSFLVERDQEAIDILLELEETFWTKHVLTQTPPPVDGGQRTTEAIREAFTDSVADVVELPAAALDLVRQIHAADAEADAAIERAESARNTIRLLLADHEVGLYAGAPLATWKEVSVNRIDAEELRAREPSVAARYTKTTSHRRLLFPKHKEV